MRKMMFFAIGAGAVVLLGAGTALAARDALAAQDALATAASIMAVPVKTAGTTVGETLQVCMYRGARPGPYRVLASSCRGGADYCTAWIALGQEEAPIVLADYDLGFAPVEATGPACDQPAPPPSGTLFRAR